MPGTSLTGKMAGCDTLWIVLGVLSRGEGMGCQGDQCVCVPDCTNKECGDDGCGGNCGFCDKGKFCSADGVCG